MSKLKQFLERNSVQSAKGLPLVHTDSAYQVKRYLQSGTISTKPCDVFKGEDLSYFFVGRPAYKREYTSQGEYWELPSCIIVNYDFVKPKRIFPFDSGAFNSDRFPSFLQLMQMSEFEVSTVSDAPERLIGSFFTDAGRYFKLKPRSSTDFEGRYSITVDDEEIRALYKLILTHAEKYDDRRFAIEIQSDTNLDLYKGVVQAVVHPEEYCESDEFMDKLDALGAASLSYSTYPQNVEYYYHAIYDTVFKFYKSRGWVK